VCARRGIGSQIRDFLRITPFERSVDLQTQFLNDDLR
jgi:hypothetical protein